MTPLLVINSLIVLLPIIAIAILTCNKIASAIILQSALSLIVAIIYLLLAAPDVALTEAAINAALSTIILLVASRKILIPRSSPSSNISIVFTILLGAIASILLAMMLLQLPVIGKIDNPAQRYLVADYLEIIPQNVGIPNMVSAILASLRGFDTWGETTVVFTAALGVSAIFNSLDHPLSTNKSIHKAKPARTSTTAWSIKDLLTSQQLPDVININITNLLIGIMIIAGLYVFFHGEYSPGGGFQAGAMLATATTALLFNNDHRLNAKHLPKTDHIWLSFAGSGVLLYGLTGIYSIVAGYNFLNYNAIYPAEPTLAQSIGIITIEVGVTITVFCSLKLILDNILKK